MKSIIHFLLDNFPLTATEKFNGVTLPPKRRRWCGPEFRDNENFLNSALAEAKRIKLKFGIKNNQNILEIGCGFGRLPIGLYQVFDSINYLGIDVHKPSIDWCNKFIINDKSEISFLHLNLKNERYNYKGEEFKEDFKFPVESKSQDLIYLYSVFSHMELEDMRKYLKDFKRIINKDGKIFFTSFIEKGVPDYSINPQNYIFEKFSGPLHVVRYDFDFMKNEIEKLGFKIEKVFKSTETDNQTGLLIKKYPDRK